MIFYKLWLLWITIQTCFAVSKKKDLTALTSLRDTIELAGSGNPGSVGSNALTESQKEAVLQLHNAFRSMVKPASSNMLKMVWDEDLENIASNFASKCIVAHNPDRHKLAKNYDWVGENIAWGTGTCGDKDCGDVYEGVKRWFSESKSYNYLTGQCSGKCTLYTQMVWWESNKLGCGAKKCGERTILVCNYAPGGNYVGQRPYKTGKACGDCPAGMACEDNLCVEKKSDNENKGNENIVEARVSMPTTPPTTTTSSTEEPAMPVATPESHMLPSGWVELPEHLTQVDSGIEPFIWGMDGKHSLYVIDGTKRENVDGTMHHVTAGQAGVWAVGLLGNVFYRRGVSHENPKGIYWEKIPGNLKQIDSGPSNVVWGVNRFNRIFARMGIQKPDRPEGSGWMRVEGTMKYVSCGEYGCWAVNKRDNVYFRVGISETTPEGSQWIVVPGKLRMVESGPGGVTAGLSDTNELFVRSGVVPEKPEGDRWLKMDLKLAHVSVGDRGIIGVLPDGTVAIHKDLNSFISNMPTITPTSLTDATKNLPLDSNTTPAAPREVTNLPTPSLPTIIASAAPVVKQSNPNLMDSLEALTKPAKDESKTKSDDEKLHITPDMAAKILKLIEQKGNQFEEHHKAAASASASNNTVDDNDKNPNEPVLPVLNKKEPVLPVLNKKEETKTTSKNNTKTKAITIRLPPSQPPPLAPSQPPPLAPSQPPPLPPSQPAVAAAPSAKAGHKLKLVHEVEISPTANTVAPQAVVNLPTEPPLPSEAPIPPETAVPTGVPMVLTSKSPNLDISVNINQQPPTQRIHHRVHPTTPKPIKVATIAVIRPTRVTTIRPVTHPKVVAHVEHHVHPVNNIYPHPRLPVRVPTHPPPPCTKATCHKPKTQYLIHTLAPRTHPTANIRKLPTYAAPHAPSVHGVHLPGYSPDKIKQKLLEKQRLHDVQYVAPLPTPSVAVAPVTVAMGLTRSCCAIPDSVCPIPRDCVGYIECRGFRGNYKNCERGQFFNPITNICDYPRNVDCEASKTSQITNTEGEESAPPQPPQPPPQPPQQVALAPTPRAASNVPQFVEASSHQVPVQQQKTTKAYRTVQPRMQAPHTDDDGVLREVWFGLGLSPLLTLLTNNPRFPTNPDEYIVLDKFEAPPNAGDGYGQRLSTYYKAPMTGEFTFYMSCDNECELWISPDTEEIHSNLILELKHGHYTSFRQWHKYPSEQTSRPIYLQQGEYYFMESFMKEGTGGDDLSIGVKLPNGEYELPIDKSLYLVPGDVSTTSVRKPGQPVKVSSSAVQATSSNQQQPVQQTATFIENVPLQPDQMGPQPGETAEQWIANNNSNKPVDSSSASNQATSEYASVANNEENIPGAEMYLNHDDMNSVEDSPRISVKRDKIIDANFTMIK